MDLMLENGIRRGRNSTILLSIEREFLDPTPSNALGGVQHICSPRLHAKQSEVDTLVVSLSHPFYPMSTILR
jgi:hypothetical protein